MKTGIWIGSVADDYTNGRIAIDDTLGAMSVAMFKVSDGLNEFYTPEDSAIWANGVYRPQGIDFMPQGNGRGFSLAEARQEGLNAGRHAAATGSEFILDLEPDPKYYWQGIPGTPHAFCQGYEAASSGIKLRLNTDARNPGINLSEWALEPIVGVWHTQEYAATFGESHELWEERGIGPLLNLGVPKSRIYPMLSNYMAGDGYPSMPPDALEASIRYYAERGYPGICLFRRMTMDGKQVERLLAMPDPWASTTPPQPPQPPPIDPLLKIRLEPVGAPTFDFTEDPAIREQRQHIRIVQDA